MKKSSTTRRGRPKRVHFSPNKDGEEPASREAGTMMKSADTKDSSKGDGTEETVRDQRKKSLMLKNLADHNRPPAEASTSESLPSKTPGASSMRHKLRSAVKDEALPKQKNYNMKHMIHEAFTRRPAPPKARKKRKVPNKARQTAKIKSKSSIASKASSNDNPYLHLPTLELPGRSRREDQETENMEVDSAVSATADEVTEESVGRGLWLVYQHEGCLPLHFRDPYLVPRFNQFQGYNLIVDYEGIAVLVPDLTTLQNFSMFVLRVHHWIGKHTGVVKVVLPESWMVDWAQVMNEPPPLDVRAYRTDVKQNESYGRFGQVFDVLPDEQRVPLGDFKQAIAADHRVLGSVFGQEAVENNDRWVAYGLSNIVTEEAILFGTQNCWPPRSPKLLSMGVYAFKRTRTALNCEDPQFGKLGPRTPIWGLNDPHFELSNAAGTVRGMDSAEYGAYKLAYAHDGAARAWTVVPEGGREKLEGLLRQTRRPEQPDDAERATLFVPEYTLRNHGIEIVKVTQHAGQMLIIFPGASHQFFNVGPNIIETMSYHSHLLPGNPWNDRPRNNPFGTIG